MAFAARLFILAVCRLAYPALNALQWKTRPLVQEMAADNRQAHRVTATRQAASG
jgi:hypothetical protein